ncbi:MAG: glycosyltransferase family 39 protein [Myxococcales bacterium]|nr:glycosyltransferase family 39 protein [Myxococcales bacterium]
MRAGRAALLGALGLAALVAVEALVRWPGFTQGGFASHDVGGILYNAMLLHAGELPYVASIEVKAPGSFYLAALLAGPEGRDIAAFQVWANLWALGSLLGVGAIGWRLWGPRAGVVAAAVYGLGDAFLDSMDANYVTWAQLPQVLAVLAAAWATTGAGRRRALVGWALAGALAGLAALAKQPAGIVLVVVAAWAALAERGREGGASISARWRPSSPASSAPTCRSPPTTSPTATSASSSAVTPSTPGGSATSAAGRRSAPSRAPARARWRPPTSSGSRSTWRFGQVYRGPSGGRVRRFRGSGSGSASPSRRRPSGSASTRGTSSRSRRRSPSWRRRPAASSGRVARGGRRRAAGCAPPRSPSASSSRAARSGSSVRCVRIAPARTIAVGGSSPTTSPAGSPPATGSGSGAGTSGTSTRSPARSRGRASTSRSASSPRPTTTPGGRPRAG